MRANCSSTVLPGKKGAYFAWEAKRRAPDRTVIYLTAGLPWSPGKVLG